MPESHLEHMPHAIFNKKTKEWSIQTGKIAENKKSRSNFSAKSILPISLISNPMVDKEKEKKSKIKEKE